MLVRWGLIVLRMWKKVRDDIYIIWGRKFNVKEWEKSELTIFYFSLFCLLAIGNIFYYFFFSFFLTSLCLWYVMNTLIVSTWYIYETHLNSPYIHFLSPFFLLPTFLGWTFKKIWYSILLMIKFVEDVEGECLPFWRTESKMGFTKFWTWLFEFIQITIYLPEVWHI